MVSTRVISELAAERDRLRHQADLIDEFLRGVAESAKGDGELRATDTVVAEEIVRPDGSFASGVRQGLRLVGRTTNSRQVADRMVAQLGYEREMQNGQPLRTRVSVELFRMAAKGTGGVKKVARGRYRIE